MIKPPEFKYHVNKDKRIIVAYGEFLPKGCIKHEIEDATGRCIYFPKTFIIKFARGMAKCNPEDEWNEELGKKIARMRAVNDFYGQMRAFWARERAILMRQFDKIDEQLKKKKLIF